MTPRAYYAMNILYVGGFLCVFISVGTIAFSDTWPWWRWFTLTMNALTVWLLCRNLPKTRALYRQWCAKRDELDRRLRHAIEREDWADVDLTLWLMRLWNVKPRVEVTRGDA